MARTQSFALATVAWGALSVALGLPTFALAQTAPQTAAAPQDEDEATQVDEIVVTGTSIRGIATVGSPTATLSREEIAATGASTIADVIRTLPSVVNIGGDESRTGGAQDAAANSTRVSSINLRGLGSEATLLLLNGRRLAPTGVLKALADPSMISAGATERIEVVLDGSSAVYGSDAVAGVVNLITRRRFDGAETSVRYGAGDGIDQWVYTQTLGKVWDNGEIFFAFEENDRSNLRRADRPFLSNDLRSRGGTDQRSTQSVIPNVNVAGTRRPFPTFTGDANRYDAGLQGDFLPEQRRTNYFLTARQRFAPDFEVWYEGFRSDRRVRSQAAPLGSAFSVPAVNPFYRTGISGVAPGANQSIEYRLPREGATSESKVRGTQNAFGMVWTLPGDWELNTYYAHSTDSEIAGIGGEQVNASATAAALRDPNPATALNVFGGPISDEVYSRIIAFRWQITDAVNDHFEVKLDGPLFSLPGGEVRGAFGASYDEGSFRYQEFQSALSPTNTASFTNDKTNSRTSTAAYFELFAPIVGEANALPFMQRLDLSVAGRYEDYSDFGDTFNPKASLVWGVTDDLNLRGSWGTSFRAPSLVDSSTALSFIFINTGPDPRNGGAQITGLSVNGSNTALKPENAETYSLGFDWTPSFLPGFQAAVTYYNIEYTDRIQVTGANLNNENVFGVFINRSPTLDQINALLNSGNVINGTIDPSLVRYIADNRRSNVGTLLQDGLDVDLTYRFDTDWGSWSVGVSHTETFNSTRQVLEGLPFIETVNTLDNPLASRGRLNAGWRMGGFNANLFYTYGGDYLNTAVTPNVDAEVQKTFDLTGGYSFQDESGPLSGVRISVNILNLFDEDPPVVINGTNGWDSTTANGIGRFASVQLSKRW